MAYAEITSTKTVDLDAAGGTKTLTYYAGNKNKTTGSVVGNANAKTITYNFDTAASWVSSISFTNKDDTAKNITVVYSKNESTSSRQVNFKLKDQTSLYYLILKQAGQEPSMHYIKITETGSSVSVPPNMFGTTGGFGVSYIIYSYQIGLDGHLQDELGYSPETELTTYTNSSVSLSPGTYGNYVEEDEYNKIKEIFSQAPNHQLYAGFEQWNITDIGNTDVDVDTDDEITSTFKISSNGKQSIITITLCAQVGFITSVERTNNIQCNLSAYLTATNDTYDEFKLQVTIGY